ncbi:MAG: hypothetical protein XD91_1683 [Clostridiales bacterium 38_11]|nr:MAG: hypothetical protein XD91_1683 [Clostridiales bacterium 38_11]
MHDLMEASYDAPIYFKALLDRSINTNGEG